MPEHWTLLETLPLSVARYAEMGQALRAELLGLRGRGDREVRIRERRLVGDPPGEFLVLGGIVRGVKPARDPVAAVDAFGFDHVPDPGERIVAFLQKGKGLGLAVAARRALAAARLTVACAESVCPEMSSAALDRMVPA